MNKQQNTKTFIIKRSDLEGRFEPEFYSSSNKNLLVKLKSKAHFKLKELVSFSNETWDQNGYFTNTFPYIEISEIDLESGNVNSFNHINILEAPSRAKMIVRNNDIIVSTTRPTRGAISFLKELNGLNIASTGFAVIRYVNEDIISKEALFNILRLPFCLQQMGQRSSGGNYPAITREELGNIIIPKVNKLIQKQIVELYQNAYTQKQQKEAEAKELLKSIDTYLLNELGITLPEKDNSIENRMFTVNFSELTGKRFDGYFYQENYITFFGLLKQSKYSVLTLKKITKIITSGITPLSGGDSYTNSNEGIPFVRSGNINIDGNLDFDNLLYLKPEIHNTIMKSSKLLKNDLLIAIVGATIGQVGIYLNEREANINQAIALIRLKEENLYNPIYIKEVIKSSIGQYNLNRLKRPVARANINLDEISTMQLIVPPIEIQNKLVEHIQKLRKKANQLQIEAKQILEEAKQEVERMILG